MLCLRKFPVAKKFMDKRGGEYQDFPSKFFCLSAEKLRGGILQCFITFGYRKTLGIIVEGEIHDFPPKLFCLTVPRHFFVEESFYAVFKKLSGSEKVYG